MKPRRFLAIAVATGLWLLPIGHHASAQQPVPISKDDIDALRKGQDAILKELQEIRKLLAAQARPAEPQGPNARAISLDVGGRPVQGDPKASVTLVEFSDYQCSFCAKYHQEVHPRIAAEFIKTGKLRRVFFDLPLESIHPLALAAAQATRCAGEQGKYFQMQDRLYGSQQTLDQWAAHAAATGLDAAKLTECVASGRYAEAVRKDMATANRAGIRSTPSFLLARTDPADPTKVAGISLVVGAKPYESFKTEIEQALAESARPR